MLVSGVVIQGAPDIERWVTRYHVEYGLDGVSWEDVRNESTYTEVCNLPLITNYQEPHLQ